MSSLFDDGKAPDAMRTIGEVSAAFGIKPHVLRYWEQQFPMLQPLKRSGGRRLYRADDIALIESIDNLVNRQGYTLKGARKALSQAEGSASPETDNQVLSTADGVSQDETIARLRSVRDRLSSALSQ